MVLSNEDEFKQKIQDGFIVESREEMTEGYRKALIVQLTVQADTELMSAPAYWMAARHAPSTNTQVSAHAIIQDELAHANIAYRLLEDIGESKEQLVYGRQPHEFKHPYGFDQPLDNWADLVVANGFFRPCGHNLAIGCLSEHILWTAQEGARKGGYGGNVSSTTWGSLDATVG